MNVISLSSSSSLMSTPKDFGCHFTLTINFWLAGAAAAVRAATTRCHGDEKRHNLTGRGPVPQNLHTEARTSQVS